jgi:hypothetical protein
VKTQQKIRDTSVFFITVGETGRRLQLVDLQELELSILVGRMPATRLGSKACTAFGHPSLYCLRDDIETFRGHSGRGAVACLHRIEARRMVSTSACRVLITLGLVTTFLAATESAPAGAVLGIDFGTDNAVIAIARRKGVDIVANEASQRLTPCIVSFSEKQRFIGEGGLGQKITNIKNTVIEPKKLVGRLCSDPEFAEIRSGFNVELVDKKGEPNVKVDAAPNYSPLA